MRISLAENNIGLGVVPVLLSGAMMPYQFCVLKVARRSFIYRGKYYRGIDGIISILKRL